MVLKQTVDLTQPHPRLKRLSLAIDPIENGAIKLTKVNLMEADKKAPLMSRPVHIADFGK